MARSREALAEAAAAGDREAARTALAQTLAASDALRTALDDLGVALQNPVMSARNRGYITAHDDARERLESATARWLSAADDTERATSLTFLLEAATDPNVAGPERTLASRNVQRIPPRFNDKIQTDLAGAVTTSAAVTSADTASTPDFPTEPAEIQALAQEKTAPRIRAAVANRLRLTPHHGAPAGALGCIRFGACSAADAASVLVAALRAAGIPARLRFGTIAVGREGADWLGGSSASAAARAAAMGGVPVQAAGDGLMLEHFWVTAHVDGKWIDLDPTYPTPRTEARVLRGRSDPVTFFKVYLGDPAPRTPAATLQGGAVARRTSRADSFKSIWSVDLTQIPSSYREDVAVSLAPDRPGSDGGEPVRVPTWAALRTGILLVPVLERESATLLKSTAQAPAYLLRAEMSVRAGGREWGRLPETAVGVPLTLQVTIDAPGSSSQTLYSVIDAGLACAVSVLAHEPGPHFAAARVSELSEVPDDEWAAAQLSQAGALLFTGLAHESGVHAAASGGVLSVGPSVAVTSAGLRGLTALARAPVTTRPDGIRMDVARMDQVLIGVYRNQDPPGFNARAGAALSAWEARALEIHFSVPTVSAVDAMKSAAAGGQRPVWLTKPAAVDALPLTPGSKAEVRAALARGRVVFAPPAPVRRAAWAGESYVVVDPKTGRGAYIVRGRLDGAVTGDTAAWLVDAARHGTVAPTRPEWMRRAGRAATVYEGWPDLWSDSRASQIVGVDGLLEHARILTGQSHVAAVDLAHAASAPPGTPVTLASGQGVALGEVIVRLPTYAANRIPKNTPGFDAKTRLYTGPAVLVSVPERAGARRLLAMPVGALK